MLSRCFLLHCSYLCGSGRDVPWVVVALVAMTCSCFLSSFSLSLPECPTPGSKDVCLCCQRITELLRLSVFPSPSAALCVVLCNQKKPLKPDVLIYNPYIGKQQGLPSCCSQSTFTSSLLPKEGLGEKSQGSGRSLLLLPSRQAQLSACVRSHKRCEPSLILIPTFN